MNSITEHPALFALYEKYGSVTDTQKINTLDRELGGPSNFYANGDLPSEEVRLRCLENQYLIALKFVTPEYF